jgi:hypothetical protein
MFASVLLAYVLLNNSTLLAVDSILVCGHKDLGASPSTPGEAENPSWGECGGKPMGRLLGKEDFIDTFGLNLSRRRVPERNPRWKEDPGAYTPEELQILKDFDDFIKNSTLDDDSKFKRRLMELSERRLRKKEKK